MVSVVVVWEGMDDEAPEMVMLEMAGGVGGRGAGDEGDSIGKSVAHARPIEGASVSSG